MIKNAIIVLLLALGISLYADNAAKTANQSLKDISYLSEPTDDDYRNKMSKLDLYIPEDVTNFPTLVYFHGGGLTAGEREGPTWMVKQGIAVVAVGYRLYPKGKHPDYITDCASATSWVFENIEAYGGDPNKIFIGGYSAGAYLAAMLAMDKKYLKVQGVDANNLAGALIQSGQMITHFTVREQLGYQKKQGVCDENSPMYHIQRTPFPIFLQCGDNDYPSRQEENRLFESMMIKYAGQPRDKIRYSEYEGTHYSLPQNKYFMQDAETFILKNSGLPHREPEVEPKDIQAVISRKHGDSYYLSVANPRGEKLMVGGKELSADSKGTYTSESTPLNKGFKLEQEIPLVMTPDVKEYALKEGWGNAVWLLEGVRIWREEGNLMVSVDKKTKNIVAPEHVNFTRRDGVELFVDRAPLEKLSENKMNYAPEDVGIKYYFFSVKPDPENREKQILRRSGKIRDLTKESKAQHSSTFTPEGYTMLITIPFSEVSPLGAQDIIGLNILVTDYDSGNRNVTYLSESKVFSGNARLHYPLFKIE